MRKLQHEMTEIDYARKPLDPKLVEEVVARCGGVAAVLNTRHAIAKAKGWKDSPPPVAEFVSAVVAEPNLLRRPILFAGRETIVGFDKAAYAKLG